MADWMEKMSSGYRRWACRVALIFDRGVNMLGKAAA